MKLNIGTLIFEVTERCNMECKHCLRGCARNIDMEKETVNKVLSQVESVTSVVFTGGEPTLNLPLIEYIFEQIREMGIELGYFWLATNGMANSLELANILLKNIDYVEEPEYCGVAISVDEFHNFETDKNPLKYLAFYDKSKEHHDDWEPKYIIKSGRAEENGIGMREREPATELSCDFDYDEDGNITWVNVEEVYVRANGDILADCDVSYDFMDENAICKADELTSHVIERLKGEVED